MFDYLRNLRKSEEEKRQEALTAYLDDALTPAERRRFEQLLASDETIRARLEEQRLIKASLRRLPRMRAPRNFTLDPARYGRPAPGTAERLYPIMRVATAVVAILFVLALVIDLSAVGGGLGGGQTLAEVAEVAEEAPAAAEEAPAAEADGQQSAIAEAVVEVTRVVEVEQEMAEMAAEEPAAALPAEEEAAAAEAAEAVGIEAADEAIEEEAPLPNPEEVTGGGGPPPGETPLAMAVPTAEDAAAATEGQAQEDRSVAEPSQPMKATAEVEAPVGAGETTVTEEAAGPTAPRAVPTTGAEPAAAEEGPAWGAAAGISALQFLAIGLGLLLLILVAATILLRRHAR